MATETTKTRITKGIESYAGEGPKWRLEHASGGQATCQQAACKREKVKIAKGELRIGTHTLFDRDGENRWYVAWRHWACATKFQIQGLKEITENDPTKAPGHDRLNPDAQEQLHLAFENDGVVDKDFKGIDTDLAKVAKRYGGDIVNAMGYKVDIATRGQSSCRKSDCPWGMSKIAKGELRLGISVPFDGENESWQYKHWMCISKYDLEAIQQRFNEDCFDGMEALPEEHRDVVVETLEKGEVMEPPQPPPPAVKSKKGKKRVEDDSETDAPKPKRKPNTKGKKKNKDTADAGGNGAIDDTVDEGVKADSKGDAAGGADQELNTVGNSGVNKGVTEDTAESKPKVKPKTKARVKAKAKGKKRSSEEFDDDSEEPEYVPRKTRSRVTPMEEVLDPTIARI